MSNVRKLSFWGNPVTDKGAQDIADLLVSTPSIKHLDMRYTGVSKRGSSAISRRLCTEDCSRMLKFSAEKDHAVTLYA